MMKYREKTCCFTGHREIRFLKTIAIKKRLRETLAIAAVSINILWDTLRYSVTVFRSIKKMPSNNGWHLIYIWLFS